MKITILTTTTILAALAGHAAARSCTDGLKYCGYNLLNIGKSRVFSPPPRTLSNQLVLFFVYIGNYRSEIVQELNNKYITVDDNHIRNSVFACGEGGHGWIIWHDFCSTGCRDGGSGASDHC